MTILNILSSQNRIEPNTTATITNDHLPISEQQQRVEKRDRSLLKMLLIQVILFDCLILQVMFLN